MKEQDKSALEKKLIEALANPKQYILVNYHRKMLNQVGAGHISPLAAYNKKEDSFLILDVARYKYPSYWVKWSDLSKAMAEVENNTRGFIIVGDHDQ